MIPEFILGDKDTLQIGPCLMVFQSESLQKQEIKLTSKETEMVIYLLNCGREMAGGEITISYHNFQPDKIKRHFKEIKLGQKK